MGQMTVRHKEALEAYEREMRRLQRRRVAQKWGYTAVVLVGMLLFFDWLSK